MLKLFLGFNELDALRFLRFHVRKPKELNNYNRIVNVLVKII